MASTSQLPPPFTALQASKEQLHSNYARLRALTSQGLNENNSQEYAQLQNWLKSATQSIQAANGSKGLPNGQASMTNGEGSASSMQSSFMTEAQTASLSCQVFAFRLLQRNQPIPLDLQRAVVDPEAALKYMATKKSPGQQNGDSPVQTAAAAATSSAYDDSPEDTSSLIYPYNAYIKPQTQPGKVTIVPTLLPTGIDPQLVQYEREKYIQARISQRIKELEDLPSTLPESNSKTLTSLNTSTDSPKLRALIELKSLHLLAKQKQLREDVIRSAGQAISLSLVSDRSEMKKIRKPTLKDSRLVDTIEKQQKADRELQAKQKHLDRIQTVVSHGTALVEAHRQHRQIASKTGRAVLRFHAEAEKAEKARVERVSKERLKALKADDEEAYLKLIDTAKDTRITHLIRQTDTFLDGLSKNVMAQQKEAGKLPAPSASQTDQGVVDETAFGAQPIFEEEEKETGKVDYYNVAHRIKETVTGQASIMVGGKLKDYQIKGLQWMISLVNNKLNGILADEMGLGKTIQSISLVTYMIEKKRINSPYLIIVPLSTIPNWIAEFAHWAPSVKLIVYKGAPNARRALADQIRQGDFQVCLTTYEFIIKDRPTLARPRWVHMIIDEGHRMKNTQSRLSQTLQQYYNTRYRLILTGTPLQNNLPELWALLNFVLPKVFNSVQSFDEWFNTPFANTGGQDKIALNEEEQLLVIRRLHKVLRPFLLRRLKKDVESDLPDKVERIIKCKMSALQLKIYKQMKEHGVLVVEDTSGKSKQAGLKGLQNTIMQLRKICNHPFVYKAVEDSVKRPHMNEELLYRVAGKFELLDRILPKLFSCGHRVLMFFQMTQIMDIMQDFLAYRGIPNCRLDGSTGQDIRGEIMRNFNAPGCEINIFLLSTRAGGLGLNLQSADTVILYDSDWNPHQDLQAQDRAHRIGQKKEVRIFRLVTSQSIEEHIVATAALKKDMDNKVIQGGKFDDKSTNAEREEHLRAILEATIEEDDIEGDYTNAELNEILARGEEEFELFQQMDETRRRRDEEQWRARGNYGPMPERLITEHELPPIYKVEPNYVVEEEPVYDLDGNRKKRVAANSKSNYADGLSEEQFLRAVQGEDGVSLQEAVEANQARKEKRRQQKMYGDVGSPIGSEASSRGQDRYESDVMSDGSVAPAQSKKKRGRPSAATSLEPSINGDDRPGKRRKTAAPKADDAMKAVYKKIIANIKTMVSPEGYDTCTLFLDLPSKKDYADYYLVIPEPISLKQISAKINKGAYHTPSMLVRDFELLVRNAVTYNDDASLVARDAHSMLDRLKSELAKATGAQQPIVLPGESDDEPAPSTKVKLKFGGAVRRIEESD